MSTPLVIKDTPVLGWRGMLLDTVRHYLPVSLIVRHIDGMELSKLNVLHWHLTDYQAFTFQSVTFPELHLQGAYKPAANNSYTREEMTMIVAYAYSRGIRVIPEIDVPGHTASWGKAFPDIFGLSVCLVNDFYLLRSELHGYSWSYGHGQSKNI